MPNVFNEKGQKLRCHYCFGDKFDTSAGVKGTGEASDQKGWYWCQECGTWVPTDAPVTYTVQYHSHPDKQGKTHFSIQWQDGDRQRGQHFREDVQEFVQRTTAKGHEVILPPHPYRGNER